MYPFYNVQPLFPFWGPFLFGRRRRRLNTISGIPVLKTTGVVATSTEVRYDVNYQQYAINITLINKEKNPQLNVMKKWLSVRLSQISQE